MAGKRVKRTSGEAEAAKEQASPAGKAKGKQPAAKGKPAATAKAKQAASKPRQKGKAAAAGTVTVNRAPVLTLWVAVVAEREGFR